MTKNMSLVKMERSCVLQADIASIITLKNQIDQCEKLLQRMNHDAVETLQRGGEVEPGMFSAELLTEWIDGKLTLQLSVNGTAV